MEELKNAIETALIKKYGSIDNLGCYNNGSWISTEIVFNLICEIINENEHLFIEE
jgi:hypothetical protein